MLKTSTNCDPVSKFGIVRQSPFWTKCKQSYRERKWKDVKNNSQIDIYFCLKIPSLAFKITSLSLFIIEKEYVKTYFYSSQVRICPSVHEISDLVCQGRT